MSHKMAVILKIKRLSLYTTANILNIFMFGMARNGLLASVAIVQKWCCKMKKYFIYAVILGLMGNALLSNASNVTLTTKSASALQSMGE